MRVLKFIVDGQILKEDPTCDFSNLVPGTENYVKLEFSFSPEWRSLYKIAGFWSMLGTEYEPQRLKDGRTCVVPVEALKRRAFKLEVGGVGADGTKITTNRITITQNGGNV